MRRWVGLLTWLRPSWSILCFQIMLESLDLKQQDVVFLHVKWNFQNNFYNSLACNREDGTPANDTVCPSGIGLYNFGLSRDQACPVPCSATLLLTSSLVPLVPFFFILNIPRLLSKLLPARQMCCSWYVKSCCKARCVLVRGWWAADQSDIVLYQSSQACCVSDRGAAFPVTNQFFKNIFWQLSF